MTPEPDFDYGVAAGACFRTASEVAASFRKGQALIVDIRAPKQFARVHVAGSLNIPEQSVAMKSFLRERSIVLTDQGFGQSWLLRLCTDLQEQGFKDVSVLRGGLTAWRQTGRKLVGPEAAWTPLDQISPRDFYREQRRVEIKLVDLTRPSSAVRKRVTTGSESQMFEGSSIRDRLRVFGEEHKDHARSNVWYLAVTQDGEGYEEFKRFVAETDAGPIFFLDGGKNGYRSYLGDRSAMENARKRVKKAGGCRTSSDSARRHPSG